MPRKSLLLFDFFLNDRPPSSSSSSSERRRGPALPLAGTFSPFFLPFSSSSSSPAPASGSSTTNRYLHFGQSIFLPIRPMSLTGTIASQLGHCCLKLEEVAMNESPPRDSRETKE